MKLINRSTLKNEKNSTTEARSILLHCYFYILQSLGPYYYYWYVLLVRHTDEECLIFSFCQFKMQPEQVYQ